MYYFNWKKFLFTCVCVRERERERERVQKAEIREF